MILLWKRFIQRYRNLVRRDEVAIGMALALGILALLLLLDLFVMKPDWVGIHTEVHGVFLELFLIAVIATIWLDTRERRQWRVAGPVLSARIMEVYNAVAEAVSHHKTRQWVYRFDGIDVPSSFDFGPLARAYKYNSACKHVAEEGEELGSDDVRYRVLACALRLNAIQCAGVSPQNSQVMMQCLADSIGAALEKTDSILDQALILVNHGPGPAVSTELMKMQQNLATLHRVIGETSERLQRNEPFTLQRLGQVAADTLEMCLINGARLASKSTKLSFFVLRENRVPVGKSVDEHVLADYQRRTGRSFASPQEAIRAMEKELPNPLEPSGS
ncbi:MAG TPA: hypothetical protein ENJ01_11120 [Gammaproteobacteria bacterium]|nr:hypothetical protein [Gammaproteobacteria bacterium]